MSMAVCPFCKDTVSDSDAFVCPACESLHHEDCWESNHRTCSVYGCESKEEEYLVGCPWCEEVYSGDRRFCMLCNSPLMTAKQCREFVESHDWTLLPLPEDSNPSLTIGYLRNHGIIARISKKPPISMFHILQKASIWIDREQANDAMDLIRELNDKFTNCVTCGHIIYSDGESCTFCSEITGELN